MRWVDIITAFALIGVSVIALWSHPMNPFVWLIVFFAYLSWRNV